MNNQSLIRIRESSEWSVLRDTIRSTEWAQWLWLGAYALLPTTFFYVFWNQIVAFWSFIISSIFQLAYWSVPLLINFIITNVFNILFYVYISIIILIPTIITIAVLAYRTKPAKESFDLYVKELLSNNHNLQLLGNYNENDTNIPANFFLRIIYKASIGLMKARFLVHLHSSRKFYYDLIICQVVHVRDEVNSNYDDSMNFIGIFNTWFPISQ